MGWGDVRYCFARAILVIIIITSPRPLSDDLLLFYVSFSLLVLRPQTKLLFLHRFLLLLLLSPQTKLGDLLFLHHFLLLLLLLLLLFLLFFSPRFCPTKFSETDDPIFTKLHRKVDPHLKRCIQVLEFSKWPPFQNGRQYKNLKNR